MYVCIEWSSYLSYYVELTISDNTSYLNDLVNLYIEPSHLSMKNELEQFNKGEQVEY